MLKILYIANSYDPHTALWSKYFSSRHQIDIFSDWKNEPNTPIYNDNITIINQKGIFSFILKFFKTPPQILKHLNMLSSIPIFILVIKQLINKNKVDIIHAHSLYYGFLTYFLPSNIPVVYTTMGSSIILHAQESPFYRFMAKKAFQRANAVTNDSLLIQNMGFKVGANKKKNYIIQNGVDTNLFSPKENKLREELNILDDHYLLFSPRAIAKLYNIDEILKSLALLKLEGIKFKCMFTFSFGNEHFDYLKKLSRELEITDYVIWLGYKDYSEMEKYYNASDLIISIPSSDSSPKSVYEAMFCGKPVIVSDLPWSHEFLEHNKNIFRTKLHDVNELAKNIKYLLENEQKRNKISSNALQKASELYSYEKNMKKMEMIMLDLIKNKEGQSK